jgi:demethylmenaquinone methyltransferase/2-methoxy-6-polyprenyl-1,4-benzoquinol methylase
MTQRDDKATYVREMFARIVDRYDLLNDLMTAGRHRYWKRVTARAAQPAGAVALDLGTGTGDIARRLAEDGARLVIAADFVPEMVAAAAGRTEQRQIAFSVADALALPFPDATFDCVTSGFLVRNVADRELAFREMWRVLEPGGRVVCLEASRRDDVIGRVLIGAFGIGARVLGRVVAGHAEAYAYLPDSAAAFANPTELAATMQRAGFTDVQYHSFGLGLIAIHRARKPEQQSGEGN